MASPMSRGDRPPPRRAAAKAADIVRRATSSFNEEDGGENSEEEASPTSVATPTGVATPTTVAQFTATLYEILGEDKSEVHCHWSDDGERVVFLDSDAFARDVCPRYFRHSKWTSFARMLNMYEFRKARDGVRCLRGDGVGAATRRRRGITQNAHRSRRARATPGPRATSSPTSSLRGTARTCSTASSASAARRRPSGRRGRRGTTKTPKN
jgi:hypothetical protein